MQSREARAAAQAAERNHANGGSGGEVNGGDAREEHHQGG